MRLMEINQSPGRILRDPRAQQCQVSWEFNVPVPQSVDATTLLSGFKQAGLEFQKESNTIRWEGLEQPDSVSWRGSSWSDWPPRSVQVVTRLRPVSQALELLDKLTAVITQHGISTEGETDSHFKFIVVDPNTKAKNSDRVKAAMLTGPDHISHKEVTDVRKTFASTRATIERLLRKDPQQLLSQLDGIQKDQLNKLAGKAGNNGGNLTTQDQGGLRIYRYEKNFIDWLPQQDRIRRSVLQSVNNVVAAGDAQYGRRDLIKRLYKTVTSGDNAKQDDLDIFAQHSLGMITSQQLLDKLRERHPAPVTGQPPSRAHWFSMLLK